MECHINTFHYLEGVPGEILYNNIKQVVIGRNRGKEVFNNELLHFGHHYSFTLKACPPYSPWVKEKTEVFFNLRLENQVGI